MRNRNYLLGALGIATFSIAAGVGAQQPQTPAPKPGPSAESYTRARAALDAAIKAYTGGKALPGLSTFSVKLTGAQHHRNQSPNAEGPPVSTPYAAQLVADFPRNWTLWERTGSFPGGLPFANRWLIKGTEGVNVDLLRNTHAQQPNAAALADNALRRLPQHLLRLAAARASTLRWLGEPELDGKKYSLISFGTATGGVLNLFIESGTNLLARWEALQGDPHSGDVTAETIFKGYTTVSGIPLPTGQLTRLGGVLTQDVDYSEWTVDATLAASVFDTPAGLRPAFVSASASPSGGAAATGAPSVQDLTGGLYAIEGIAGYRVLFQEFRDFVMVFEAPQNEATSQTVKRLVREKLPSKPIRYVAITHHHDDHSGGFRSYWADCIALITTPGNQPFLRRSLAGRFTIQPDAYATNTPSCGAPITDYVTDKRGVFTDGTQRVELIDMGPGPHAQEMLVFWFPAQRVLFQGDLWNREADSSIRPATDTTVHFAEWLQKSGLPVERIIGVHGPSGTPAELQQAVQMRRGN